MVYDNLSAVVIAIAFIVPGLVLSTVLALSFRRRSRSASELTLQFLTLSCINHGLWSWLIVPMISDDWFGRFPFRAGAISFVIIFVSPIILGLLATALSRREGVQRALAVIGFKIQRFIPTAWDYKFGLEEPSWIIVRLKDGSSVYGFWGTGSFAGDDPGERDLFIEAVFQPADGKHWQPVLDTGGILIRGDEVGTIEFLRIESMEGVKS